jgi:hypothetical protein
MDVFHSVLEFSGRLYHIFSNFWVKLFFSQGCGKLLGLPQEAYWSSSNSKEAKIMDADQVMREQLLALLRGGNAHMGFDKAVADFPMAFINHKPPQVTYTPWHLLEHMRLAQWDILEFIKNPAHVSPAWPEGYWPDPEAQANEADWERTLATFRADLKALQDLVTDRTVDLLAPIPHAQSYTIFREILVVADHNAYHTGEFAILRQVMGTWPES